MSAFSYLMTDAISIRRLTATSTTGLQTYVPARSATAATIHGRLEMQRKIIVNKAGKETVSEAVLYTPDAVNEGDLIIDSTREWPVLQVKFRRGLFGATDHYEARL